ncbi:hypothetical protein AK812_SmicGene5727 [Symbiodinium microadriaticum]|uniref:Uncharacterized protein n=1 Tax=Symbiodinium microadriaticum TaxID=2951 RepID=A0A1Q9ESW5_SYMMI|nr:hypothetical protein AK812_SmicGene5727 [Symbiodinium microadriaticum]
MAPVMACSVVESAGRMAEVDDDDEEVGEGTLREGDDGTPRAATKAVLSAEDIVAGHYRLASEKKKAEKAASKEGGTTTDGENPDSSWDAEGQHALELLDALDSCQSYGSGRTLTRWLKKQEWSRTALPQAFQLDVPMAIRSYWQEELAATNTFLRKHPAFDDPDCNLDFVVPLRLYGDGAAIMYECHLDYADEWVVNEWTMPPL